MKYWWWSKLSFCTPGVCGLPGFAGLNFWLSDDDQWNSQMGLHPRPSSPPLFSPPFRPPLTFFRLLVAWNVVTFAALHLVPRLSPNLPFFSSGRCGALAGWAPPFLRSFYFRVAKFIAVPRFRQIRNDDDPIGRRHVAVFLIDFFSPPESKEFLLRRFLSFRLFFFGLPPRWIETFSLETSRTFFYKPPPPFVRMCPSFFPPRRLSAAMCASCFVFNVSRRFFFFFFLLPCVRFTPQAFLSLFVRVFHNYSPGPCSVSAGFPCRTCPSLLQFSALPPPLSSSRYVVIFIRRAWKGSCTGVFSHPFSLFSGCEMFFGQESHVASADLLQRFPPTPSPALSSKEITK